MTSTSTYCTQIISTGPGAMSLNASQRLSVPTRRSKLAPSVQTYLPGENPRARRMRLDTASILKRFFFCEKLLIIGQAGWLVSIAPLGIKTMLPRVFWEDAMTAHALRERVFELRYPSRLMLIGEDAPLIDVFQEAVNAPSAEAYLLTLARVLKPALLRAYRQYIEEGDNIADGPTLRFVRFA